MGSTPAREDAPLPPLDWSSSFEPGEREALLDYYRRGTGDADLEDLAFIRLMADLRPDALKRYRLAIDAGRRGLGELPDAARALASLHDHLLAGYAKGIRYDLRGSRRRGASRGDVLHVLAIAWLHGSNEGIHHVADLVGDELRAWDTPDPGEGIRWPDAWGPDAGAWSCGVDWAAGPQDRLTPDELGRLEAWHRDVEGDVPAFVPFLVRWNPIALRTYRARYEGALHGPLPRQFVALLLVATATQPASMRRALHMARSFGVTTAQAVSMLTRPRAIARGLGSQGGLDLAEVDGILDRWAP